MHLPSYIFYPIVASVFVVLILGFIGWRIMMKKAKKIRLETIENNALLKDIGNKELLERHDKGVMLWDLKDLETAPMEDESVEFIINTIIRNNYKSIFMMGKTDGYEAISVAHKIKGEVFIQESSIKNMHKFLNSNKKYKTNVKIIKNITPQTKFDLVFINKDHDLLLDKFDLVWQHIKLGGLFVITGANKKNRAQKELIGYFKMVGIRFEIKKWGNWFILAAK